MRKSLSMAFTDHTVFHNVRFGAQPFKKVFRHITDFLREDRGAQYCISVGSDSQTSSKATVFVTCIIVHRVGKGAIGFYTRQKVGRPIKNLREKLSLETMSSLQLTYLFNEERIGQIYDILSLSKGDVDFEFHIDIGEKGPTRAYISEMVGMARGLYFIPRIKPQSYCASSYADKHSKTV